MTSASISCRKEVWGEKGKRAQVPKRLIRGLDGGHTEPRGRLRGVRKGQSPVKLLGQKGGVYTHMGGHLDRLFACQPWSDPPPPPSQTGSR